MNQKQETFLREIYRAATAITDAIDRVENRALAVDGPVTPTSEAIMASEWEQINTALARLHKAEKKFYPKGV